MKHVRSLRVFESRRPLTETQIEETAEAVENLIKITGSMPSDLYFEMNNPPSKFKDLRIVYNPTGVFLHGHGRVQETINIEHKDGYSWLSCSSYRMVGNIVKLATMFDEGLSDVAYEWLEETYSMEDIPWEEGIQDLIKNGPIDKLKDEDFKILSIDAAPLRGRIGGKRTGLI